MRITGGSSYIKWDFVEELQDERSISEIEKMVGIKFPQDFVDCVKKYNAANPEPNSFDTDIEEGHVFDALLSFNNEDLDNIYSSIDGIEFFPYDTLAPIALDPFGNFICYDKRTLQLKFWNHETGETEFIANTFTEFLDKLYD